MYSIVFMGQEEPWIKRTARIAESSLFVGGGIAVYNLVQAAMAGCNVVVSECNTAIQQEIAEHLSLTADGITLAGAGLGIHVLAMMTEPKPNEFGIR